jgi:Asp-tRNA(Asn)/Glu-tRNA(Gln) amidotransferase A subunit family amidase
VAAEAFKVHQGRDQDRYAEGTRALLGFGASVTAQQYTNALRQRAELTAAIEASLTGVDVLAGPTVGYQAPEQDPPLAWGKAPRRAASPARTISPAATDGLLLGMGAK